MKTRFAVWFPILTAVLTSAAWAAPASNVVDPAEAKAKAAWTTKVTAYKLCAAQDKVAQGYRSRVAAMGKTPPEPVATPACADPGPFVYTSTQAASSREDSGAHSSAETSSQPPGTAQPESAGKPQAK